MSTIQQLKSEIGWLKKEVTEQQKSLSKEEQLFLASRIHSLRTKLKKMAIVEER